MSRLTFGPFVLEPVEERLVRDGQVVDVQPLVLRLLIHAALRPGQLLPREELGQLLWPDVTVTPHSLTQVVHRLREHLGEHREWWQTVPKRGFRFDAPVVADEPTPDAGPDAFFGRHDELALLAGHWGQDARWVTLLGPAGAGKTRLALEHVRRGGHPFPWAVRVDLAGVSTAAAVPSAVAGALGVAVSGREDPLAQVGRALAHRGRGLVLLDNLEQLLPHAAPTMAVLVDAAPEARWLATSRTRTGLDVDTTYELPLAAVAARGLFVARSRQAGTDLDDQDEAIDAIVGALEGNPLAIELAAARTPLLAPSEIRVRLDERLRLLSGGRTGPARHRSLHAAVEWSWQLLEPWERRVLTHVSLFAGGFTVGMAERVADAGTDAPTVLDVLQALRDHSLLQREAAQARPEAGRLRLTASVRAFAQLHVPELDPDRSVRDRFVALMTERAVEAERLLFDWDHARSREAEADLDSALFAVGLASDPSGAVAIAAPLARWLVTVGRGAEARPLLRSLPEAPLPPSVAGRLLVAVRFAAHYSDSADRAEPEAIVRGAEEAEASGDLTLASDLWMAAGADARHATRLSEALRAHLRGAEVALRLGDPTRRARHLHGAGISALASGDHAGAGQFAVEGLSACPPERSPSLRAELHSLKGYAAGWGGSYEAAEHDLTRAVAIAQAHDLPVQRLFTLSNLAALRQEHGHFAQALEAQDAAVDLVRHLGMGGMHPMMLNNRALTRIHLGDLGRAEDDLIEARAFSPNAHQSCLIEMNTAALEAVRGRFDRAVAHADASLAQGGDGLFVAAGLLWAALGEAGLGHPEAARAHLARVDALDRSSLPPFLVAAFAPVRALVLRLEARGGDAAAAREAAEIEASIDLSVPLVALAARAVRNAAA